MPLTQDAIDDLFGAAPGTPAAHHPRTDDHPCDPKLRRILKLSVPLSVTLVEQKMSVVTILAITVGTILEFDESTDASLNLNVLNRRIGCGQAVKVGENFGLRITSIGTVRERIGAMSPR